MTESSKRAFELNEDGENYLGNVHQLRSKNTYLRSLLCSCSKCSKTFVIGRYRIFLHLESSSLVRQTICYRWNNIVISNFYRLQESFKPVGKHVDN